ncbi:TIGR03751 family conjugal transfer lipoprotein [Variovorax sp. ZS18.2.2]|uniref:TIGR03751 family conjugal transfer lipoprotein n=1 Tax=Variovorax sp. ZS18.2.2 TaxID=2971255 RepID=UPI00215115E4|nr:TIGR03751 family conjugal transfer lipoprotein [Variovorax sp. ZS18.2.2]MCR6480991.1 TIGR03751 family conjugal transfer lipoprotein [Variovorax sp. ZS18.2.2]
MSKTLTHARTSPRALLAALLIATCLAGCSVTGPRESPLNEVTRGSPTVTDVYRGKTVSTKASERTETPQQLLRRQTSARGVAQGDGDTSRYWSALEPMRQRFARVPNPDLVMVVYPHLAKGQYPVPGYVTVFPMYEQVQYALPGEVPEDLLDGRAIFGKTGDEGKP